MGRFVAGHNRPLHRIPRAHGVAGCGRTRIFAVVPRNWKQSRTRRHWWGTAVHSPRAKNFRVGLRRRVREASRISRHHRGAVCGLASPLMSQAARNLTACNCPKVSKSASYHRPTAGGVCTSPSTRCADRARCSVGLRRGTSAARATSSTSPSASTRRRGGRCALRATPTSRNASPLCAGSLTHRRTTHSTWVDTAGIGRKRRQAAASQQGIATTGANTVPAPEYWCCQ